MRPGLRVSDGSILGIGSVRKFADYQRALLSGRALLHIFEPIQHYLNFLPAGRARDRIWPRSRPGAPKRPGFRPTRSADFIRYR
jgi:hypothetical protein